MPENNDHSFDPKNIPLEDPHPNLPLDKINLLSSRAWTLLIRSKDKNLVRRHFISIVGAIDMMRGLEYHHENFCRIITELGFIPLHTPLEETKRLGLVHEAVAYLNRLGQFYYFASSEFVSNSLPQWRDIIPTIFKFKRFRDKHSAHRSLDTPRFDDNPRDQQVHAWTFSSLGGIYSQPKPGVKPLISYSNFINPYKIWIERYCCFQLKGNGKQGTINLSVEREHPIFINEAYGLIFTLLSKSRKEEDDEL